MSKKSLFLDSDTSMFEENLRFVKNDFEDEMNTLFGGAGGDQETTMSNKKFKIIKPTPGLCLKAFREGGGGKVFINICQTDEILAPRELSENELIEILNSEQPNSFKIPMSISEPYTTKDKSGNSATASDIAINTKFFVKIRDSKLFCNFLVALIFEAIENKYQIKCEEDNWTILKNLKSMSNGNLKSHRIEDRDNEEVKKYYNINEEKKSLIQEISDADASKLKSQASAKKVSFDKYVPDPVKLAVSQANYKKPDYRLIKKVGENNKVERIIGEFHLPEVRSASEITVDLGEDRVVVEARKNNYLIEGFLTEFVIDPDQAETDFDTGRSVLTVHMPVMKVI